MDVFGIFIVVSFIGLIATLVVMNIIKRIKKAQEYKPYSEYYNQSVSYVDGENTNIKSHNDLQERVNRKSFGLTKERAERISLKTKQAYLDKYSVLGDKCDHIIVDDSWCQREVNETQEKYLETLPHHKTRVKNRRKRQRKK